MLEKFCDILLFVLIFNVSDSASQDKIMGVASRKKNLEIDDIMPMGRNNIKTESSEERTRNNNNKRADYFLKRIIQTFLYRLGNLDKLKDTGSHVHLEIEVVLSHTELKTLTDFANFKEDSNNYQEIDDIISNIFVNSSENGWLFSMQNVSLLGSIQVFVIASIIFLGIYTFATAWYKLVQYRKNLFVQVFVCFQLLCILSYTWEFIHSYEESTSKVASARQSFIDQCDPTGIKETNGILGYIHVQLYGCRDECEKLYILANKNPLWSVNPLEIFAKSWAGLVFSQLPFIGEMFGHFINNIMFIVPNWMKPFVIGPLLLLLFMGIFGFRVVTPIFTLETRGVLGIRNRGEQRPLPDTNNLNVVEPQH